VYLDRLGLAGAPPDVDVRRFRGKGGEDLLVTDNWHRVSAASVLLDGRRIDLPAEPLSIVVVPRGGG
jgi:hypothetical protein